VYNNHNLLGNGHHFNTANAQSNSMHRIPNRIFVGGIPQNTSQNELRDYFSHFGHVKDARIIMDQHGNSKGYGFVTYNNEHDASKVLSVKEEDLVFKENKLNVGHAFRKNNNQQTNTLNAFNNGHQQQQQQQQQQHHHAHHHQNTNSNQFLRQNLAGQMPNMNNAAFAAAAAAAATASSQTTNNYIDAAQLAHAYQQQQQQQQQAAFQSQHGLTGINGMHM
jgi:RNA recognition motif-containing protein